MRSGYILLSLLLACALDAGCATFVIGTSAGVAAAALAVGAVAVIGNDRRATRRQSNWLVLRLR